MALGVMINTAVAQGLKYCLRVMVFIALLVPDILKFTNDQNLTVLSFHYISGILSSKV